MDAIQGLLDGDIFSVEDFLLASANYYHGAKFEMKQNGCWEAKQVNINPRYQEQLKESYEKFILYSTMQYDMLEQLMNKELDEIKDKKEKQLQELLVKRSKCLSMIESIREWKTPSPDYVELKNQAIKTLQNVIDLECNDIQEEALRKETEKITVSQFATDKINYYLKQIQYYSRKYSEQIEYAQEKNRWMSNLFNSFHNKEEK